MSKPCELRISIFDEVWFFIVKHISKLSIFIKALKYHGKVHCTIHTGYDVQCTWRCECAYSEAEFMNVQLR